MEKAIDETERRREIQEAYNEKHGIVPKTIQKRYRDVIEATMSPKIRRTTRKELAEASKMTKKEREKVIEQMEKEMKEAAKALTLNGPPSCGT